MRHSYSLPGIQAFRQIESILLGPKEAVSSRSGVTCKYMSTFIAGNPMLVRIRQFLAAPAFENHAKTRTARWTNLFTLVFGFVILTLGILLPFSKLPVTMTLGIMLADS